MPTINVKDDYGAVGDGATPDTTAIQNAFDAAFGTSGSPHGTNTALNSDVYFPYGQYLVGGLTLTDVKSGRIYGQGVAGASFKAANNNSSILAIDGMSDTSIENMGFTGTNPVTGNVTGIDLNWTGSGAVGLGNNTFFSCGGNNCTHLVRIARGGFGGAGNTFQSCISSNCNCFIRIESATATDQVIIAGGSGDTTGSVAYWAELGNFSYFRGVHMARTAGGPDIKIDGGGTTIIRGGRSESNKYVSVTNGTVTVSGVRHGGFDDPTNSFTVELAGASARVQVDCCTSNDNVGSPIKGTTGDLWIRQFVYTQGDGTILNVGGGIDFTGTLHYFRTINCTVANLPTPPRTNMEAIVTDGSGTPTLDSTVAGGGSGKFLVRYNGSNWVVKGK